MWQEEVRRLPRGEHNAGDRLRHLVVWLAALNIVLLVALALGGLAYVRLTKEAERQRQELAELWAQAAGLAGLIDSVEREALRRQEAERLVREQVDTLIARALAQESALREQVETLIAAALAQESALRQQDVNRLHQRVNCVINYLNYRIPTVC
jgi:uncharacterized membrane protein